MNHIKFVNIQLFYKKFRIISKKIYYDKNITIYKWFNWNETNMLDFTEWSPEYRSMSW